MLPTLKRVNAVTYFWQENLLEVEGCVGVNIDENVDAVVEHTV